MQAQTAGSGAVQIHFDIPAQPAGEAFNAFARQSGWRILFPFDAVEDKRVNAIQGAMSQETALDRLLQDTGLAVASREDGVITLCVPEGDGCAQPRGADAEPPRPVHPSPAVQEDGTRNLGAVIVTGTRFSNRTVLESAVPVDVLTQEDMRSGGYSDTPSMLAALLPSFSFRPTYGPNTAAFMRRASIRGLSSSQTLVLLNGKRRHLGVNVGAAAADFNSFPPTAIGRVEVLRDGAAAQYGSDAIAGVVNMIMRRDIGTEIETTLGQTYEGDGGTLETSIDHGFEIGDGGFFHTSLYMRRRDPTNRQGYDKRQMYFGYRDGQPIVFPTAGPDDATPVLQPGDSFDPREFTVDRENSDIIGDPRVDEKAVSFNSELPLGSATLYAFGGYMRREIETRFILRRPLDNNNVRAIFPDGFQPRMLSTVTDASFNLGVKGTWGEWDYDLSQGWGSNGTRVYPKNTVNPSMGVNSPTEFYGGENALQQAVTNFDLRRSFESGWGAPLYLALGTEYRWERFEMRAGSPEGYTHGGVPILDGPNAGGYADGTSQGFTPIRPQEEQNARRHNYALYADAETLLRDKLTVSAAARFEDYSDFGTTFDGKLAFRYAINDFFALRGSASTGFRAPTLADSYYTSGYGTIIDGASAVVRTFTPSDPLARMMGAKDLEPEESLGFSVGGTLQLLESRFNISLDLYQIEVNDQLVGSSLFNDARARAFFAANGYPDIAGGSFRTNAVDAQVRGLDLTGDYRLEFDNRGMLTLTAAINFNNREILRIAESPPELAAITDIPLFNPASLLNYSRGEPRRTFNFSGNYQIGDWSFFARMVRYGEIYSNSSNPLYNQRFGAKWLTDLSVSNRIGETFTVTLGANNAFDVYPDRTTPINNAGGNMPYYAWAPSPFGFNGGYYYLRFKASF